MNDLQHILYILILIVLLILSRIDIKKRRVPAEMVLAGACFYYLYIFIVWNKEGYQAARSAFISGVAGAVVLFVMTFIAAILTGVLVKGNALGGGDIRLFSLLGLCLGLDRGLAIVLFTCVFAAGYLIIKKVTVKHDGQYLLADRQFPLVPCITLSWIVVIVGTYLNI